MSILPMPQQGPVYIIVEGYPTIRRQNALYRIKRILLLSAILLFIYIMWFIEDLEADRRDNKLEVLIAETKKQLENIMKMDIELATKLKELRQILRE